MPCLQPFRGDSEQLLLYKIALCLSEGGFVAGVSSFNGQTGPVTFTGGDVITLLGFTPISESDGDARYVLKTGDTMTGALAIGNGVLVANAPVLSLSQTWNNAAVAFTGSLLNVTNTAASAASILFDVQQNAVTVFNLRTDGRLTLTGRASFTTTSSIGHSLNVLDAVTASAVNALSLNHSLSAGTAAAGFGVRLNITGDTATVVSQLMLRADVTWIDAAQATRTSAVTFSLPVSGTDTTTLVLTNGQVQARAGTVSLPSFTTSSDPDTGVFFNGTNDLFISAGGTQVAAFTDTTGIILSTSLTLPYVAKAATYTATAVDYTIDCTSGTFDIDLPTAVGITGRIYVIKNSGVGTITIDPAGAELIDSLATATLVSGASITTQSTGTGWIII